MATNNHGRPERVLISSFLLKLASDTCLDALRALAKEDGDPVLRNQLEGMAGTLHKAATGKPYKLQHRAPKGHAIVPKALLQEAIGDLYDGANEFEDAAGYCNDTDAESCTSHGDGIRQTANRLKRYAR